MKAVTVVLATVFFLSACTPVADPVSCNPPESEACTEVAHRSAKDILLFLWFGVIAVPLSLFTS